MTQPVIAITEAPDQAVAVNSISQVVTLIEDSDLAVSITTADSAVEISSSSDYAIVVPEQGAAGPPGPQGIAGPEGPAGSAGPILTVWDGASYLSRRIVCGAADSAGAGYRTIKIEN